MYKIICETEPNFLHSCGYYDRAKAQARIDSGDIYKYMYPADKLKKFIVVSERAVEAKKAINNVDALCFQARMQIAGVPVTKAEML